MEENTRILWSDDAKEKIEDSKRLNRLLAKCNSGDLSEILNNRFMYHEPKDDDQVLRYKEIRGFGKRFAELIHNACPKSREKSLAMTKIEEAVMWANASIARNE